MLELPPSAPMEDPAVARRKVLVVDDNLDMREYLTRLLDSFWTVETATDGEDALARVKVSPPDLILSDMMSTGEDALGTLRGRGPGALRRRAGRDAPPCRLRLRARGTPEWSACG
jgi:CheY-like chemotaxis protein